MPKSSTRTLLDFHYVPGLENKITNKMVHMKLQSKKTILYT